MPNVNCALTLALMTDKQGHDEAEEFYLESSAMALSESSVNAFVLFSLQLVLKMVF